jgi:hypothetical protein
VQLFEKTLEWLKDNYGSFRFFVERDIVWAIQTHLICLTKELGLPCKVFSDYPITPGKYRSLCTDLAILNGSGIVEVAAEFKYEPAHTRDDILPSKFPVVSWGKDGVAGDVNRIQKFVTHRSAQAAYSIFIDEGGYFRHRKPHPGSEWLDWDVSVCGPNCVAILYSQARANSESSISKGTSGSDK